LSARAIESFNQKRGGCMHGLMMMMSLMMTKNFHGLEKSLKNF
jgi:hypothetical protein